MMFFLYSLTVFTYKKIKIGKESMYHIKMINKSKQKGLP